MPSNNREVLTKLKENDGNISATAKEFQLPHFFCNYVLINHL